MTSSSGDSFPVTVTCKVPLLRKRNATASDVLVVATSRWPCCAVRARASRGCGSPGSFRAWDLDTLRELTDEYELDELDDA